MCDGGSNTQVSSSRLPPALQKRFIGLLDRADTTANLPYAPYGGPRQAPFTPDQNASFDMVRDAAGTWQPDFDAARGQIGIGAAGTADQLGTFDTDALSRYGNPYTSGVIDATMKEIGRQGEIQRVGLDSKATMSGAFGGDRAAIEKTEQMRNQSDLEGRTIAGLLSQNFQQAQQQFNTEQGRSQSAREADRQRALAASGAYQGIGMAGQDATYRDAAARQGIGAMQQQFGQQGLDFAYGDFREERQYPFDTTQWLSGIYQGFPTNQFATQYNTQPGANPYVQAAGLGIGAAGVIGGGLGWFKRGGLVGGLEAYAAGGRVTPGRMRTIAREAVQRHNRDPRAHGMRRGGRVRRMGYAAGGPISTGQPYGSQPQNIDLSEAYATMPTEMLHGMAESGDPVAKNEIGRRMIGYTGEVAASRGARAPSGIGAIAGDELIDDASYAGSHYAPAGRGIADAALAPVDNDAWAATVGSGLTPDEQLLRRQAEEFTGKSAHDRMRESREGGIGDAANIIEGESNQDAMRGGVADDGAFTGKLWGPLAAAGFSLAASRNPSGLGALGEAGIGALQVVEDRRRAEAEAERQAYEDEIERRRLENEERRAGAYERYMDELGAQKRASPPATRERYDAGQIIQEERDPTSGEWHEIGRGPRWQANGGSGVDSGAWEVIDLPGVGKVQRNKRTGKVESLPGSGSDLTSAQFANNTEIDAARNYITTSGFTMDEIVKRTQETTATGRDNLDFDPYLAKTFNLAMGRKVGADPEFESFQSRFRGGSAPTDGVTTEAAPSGTRDNPLIPNAQADIDNAPAGTVFRGPDGALYVK